MNEWRWPLHPTPLPGECLSSWLKRIASLYEVSAEKLVFQSFGVYPNKVEIFDWELPVGLVDGIAERTGQTPATVASLSFVSHEISLFASLDGKAQLNQYIAKMPIIVGRKERAAVQAENWIPWVVDDPRRPNVGCRECTAETPTMMLLWKIPIVQTCPRHGCYLEPCTGPAGDMIWYSMPKVTRLPSDAELKMDRRTWEAFLTGKVVLPRRTISAGIWYRMLRGLIHDLSQPMKSQIAYQREMRSLWQEIGMDLKRGTTGRWRPFEELRILGQRNLLTAAANTMDLAERVVLPRNAIGANLFKRRPTMKIRGKWAWYRRETFNQTFDRMLVEARDDPQTASEVRKMLYWGQDTPEQRTKVDEMLRRYSIIKFADE